MNITTVNHVNQLPKCELRCYSLTDGETEESAAEKYEKYYRVPPERGWVWGQYVYFEIGK